MPGKYNYRKNNLANILFFLLLVPFSSYSVDELTFRWAFIKHSNKVIDPVLDFSKEPVVNSGDKLRIYIEPLNKAYIYLYLHDSSKNLSLLFPADFVAFTSDTYNGQANYIPGINKWFTLLGPPGIERFHLIASRQRLDLLEHLTLDHEAENNSKTKAALLSELKNLRKTHSNLTTEAEIGISIAGTIRSIETVPAIITGKKFEPTEVRAQQFYGKTIRLNHE